MDKETTTQIRVLKKMLEIRVALSEEFIFYLILLTVLIFLSVFVLKIITT